MFAALLTGQLVQSNFNEVSPGKLLLDLPPLGKSNHIVVFLTGQAPLPDGYGAGVHFGIVENGMTLWSYLGFLTNERPSAIFKVSGLKPGLRLLGSLQQSTNPFQSFSNSTAASVTAQLGISIEPLSELALHTPAVDSSTATESDEKSSFAKYAAENLFNFVAGCAQEVPGTSEAYVPISSIKRWFDSILRKLSIDPNFWK